MPNYPSRSLADRFISESFQDILQIYNGDLVLDGTGTLLFNVSDIGTGGGGPSVSSSYALSASYAESSSYAWLSTSALSASYAPTTLPPNIVSSSIQINTGSFTGSFIGLFTASYIKLDPQPVLSDGEGTIFYDSTRRSLAIVDDSLTILYPSEDQLIRISNNSGVTIPKGSVVEYAGSPGGSGRVLGKLAIAINRTSSSLSILSERIKLLGIAHESISNGADGHVMVSGEITNVNTSAFTSGQALYLSETTSGSITGSVNSNFDQHRVGFAINSHASQGRIYVNEFLDHRIFYTSILNVPVGIVSSSVQATTWTVASSSWSSTAVSSSYASTALSASYAPGSPSVSASYAVTASYTPTALSASYAPGSPSVSASYAVTASYAVNGGGGSPTLPTGVVSSSVQTIAHIANQTIAPSIVSASTAVTASSLTVGTNNQAKLYNANADIVIEASGNINFASSFGNTPLRLFSSASTGIGAISPYNFNVLTPIRSYLGFYTDWDTTYRSRGTYAGVIEFASGNFMIGSSGSMSTLTSFVPSQLLLISSSGVVSASSFAANSVEINRQSTAGAVSSNYLTLYAAYAANSAVSHSIIWRDVTNTTGKIDTRFNGTSVDMFFGSLYNGGYNNSDIVTIKGTGRVGIGTMSPGAVLHVQGDVSASILKSTGGLGINAKSPAPYLAPSASAGATYTSAEQNLLNQIRDTLIAHGLLQ